MVDLRLQVAAAVMVMALAAGTSSGGRFEFQEATVDAIQRKLDRMISLYFK